MSYDEWKRKLISIISLQTNTPIAQVEINEDEALKWYKAGIDPYYTFRECYKLKPKY